jgi:hypothetical protein
MRFARQLGVVLETYLTRPAFIIIVLVGLASLGIIYGIGRWGYHVEFGLAIFLVTVVLYTLPVAMALAFIVMFFLHVRQQLRGTLAALTPEFRGAHLIVAGLIFFGIVLGITAIYYDRNVGQTPWNFYSLSFFGVFLVVWTFMTLAALASIESPWWLLELIPLMIALVASRHIQYYLDLFVLDFHGYTSNSSFYRLSPQWQNRLIVDRTIEAHYVWFARVVIIALNAIAMAFVSWRAKPLTNTPWSLRMIDKALARLSRPKKLVEISSHRPLATLLRRASHRRFAVHDPRMGWGIAGSVAGLCTLITLLVGHDPRHLTTVAQSLVLASVIPGAVVAAGWRERWPSLGYESLLPSRRDQFAIEMALAMAIDLAEFWIAGWLGALVPLLIWEPGMVLSHGFLLSVAASGLMQVLLFGGALLAARWRTGIVFGAIMLMLLMLAIFVPMLETWSDHPSLKPAGLLIVAVVEMGAGLVMAITGHAFWTRGEFA